MRISLIVVLIIICSSVFSAQRGGTMVTEIKSSKSSGGDKGEIIIEDEIVLKAKGSGKSITLMWKGRKMTGEAIPDETRIVIMIYKLKSKETRKTGKVIAYLAHPETGKPGLSANLSQWPENLVLKAGTKAKLIFITSIPE
ncbi:MAG: hypothetical protein HRU15_17950 [Planctomycetes bacterium]|nr:hypothetical protein [Planctomycetota bacterium]